MMSALFRLAPVALLALACAGSGDLPVPDDARPREAGSPLPSWALPGERAGKSDAAADIREATPEHYVLTVPPQRPVRPMVEWEPMQALALTATDWLTKSAQVKATGVSIIEATTPVADVWVLFGSAQVRSSLEAALATSAADLERVTWVHVPHESIWMVDYGPFPIVDPASNTTAFVDFRYFAGRPLDDAVPTRLGRLMGASTYRQPAAFEGGNLLADGHGRCFTTQRGLQQSGLPLVDLEAAHRDYLGCDELTVLHDILGDPTGHVDMFMKVVGDGRIVLGRYDDGIGDPTNQQRLEENRAILDAVSADYAITRIPMPGYHVEEAPGGLGKVVVPLTYVNATHVNGVNLWPRFADPAYDDTFAEAQAAWAAAMPDYQHVPIVADELARAGGAIHCITRTVPAPPLARWVPDGTCEQGMCVPPQGYSQTGMSETCTSDDICFGPAWLCDDCGEAPGEPCEGIPFEGCCAQGTLKWCDGGVLKSRVCDGACGWDPRANYYACGTDGARSPYTEFPHACPCTPSCQDRICGDDGCGGSCGACEQGLECAAAGVCAEPGVDGGDPPVPGTPASPGGCLTAPRGGDMAPGLVILLVSAGAWLRRRARLARPRTR